jgi:hypothetical protein
MRRQHARVRPGRAAGPAHALDQPLEDRRRTGHRRRAERGHPIADQAPCDLLDGIERVERVEALHPVHVHVDEAGDQRVAVQIDEPAARPAGTGRARPRLNFRDPAVLDDDGPRRQHAIGQDDVGAAQDQRPGKG